jgi:hypothetical protein
MSITAQDLATLAIHHVIFHDVPRNARGADAQPVLADDETAVDATQKHHLKTRLIRAIGSKSAYPVCFNAQSSSRIPAHVRSFTQPNRNREAFVAMSQELAGHLFEQHHGGVSPGLLCVSAVTAAGQSGLAIMKLEREEGARLELEERRGRRVFSMSVLNNLVLTDGTRLFKSALFLRTGRGDDDFRSLACDSQLNIMSSDDMAKFWLRFLGCTFVIEPRVATQRFYESAVRFINNSITDAIQKNDLYEHLQSQLKAPARTFSPRRFIQDYVPEAYRGGFQEHLESEHVSLSNFQKDLSDIQGRVNRLAYHTPRGAIVSAPAEERNLVEVTDQNIIVNDTVSRVDK